MGSGFGDCALLITYRKQHKMKEENIKSNKGRGEDVNLRRKRSSIARAQVTRKS